MSTRAAYVGLALTLLIASGCADPADSETVLETTSQPAITADLTAYTTEGRIVVSYSGMSGAWSDWIAIAPVGSPSNTYIEWKYTGGSTSGALAFTQVPVDGVLEARAFYDWMGTRSHVVQQRSEPFSVTSMGSVATDKLAYFTGAPISVVYSNLPTENQVWLAIAPRGAPFTTYLDWKYKDRSSSGSLILTAPATPGTYVARAFGFNRYLLIDESPPFAVTVAPTLSSPSPIATRSPIIVSFSEFQGTATDWITLAGAGSPPTSYVRWTYTGGGTSGTVSFRNDLPAGNYELRGYFDYAGTHSYTVRTAQALTINDSPRVDGVNITPDSVLHACQEAILTAVASDPNNDALSFTWELLTGEATLRPTDGTAVFVAGTPGDYSVRVTGTDPYGAAASLVVPLHVTEGDCPWFRWIGASVTAISADGTTVTGTYAVSPSTQNVFRWTALDGMTNLGGDGYRPAVNADGTVIVATLEESQAQRAYRWTESTGWVRLEAPDSQVQGSSASAVSADGHIVFGTMSADGTSSTPFRWTESSGMTPLPGRGLDWFVLAISADASVAVGRESVTRYITQAIRWTQSSGPLSVLSTNYEGSTANDVSADGRVVVGHADNGYTLTAFRWTEESGVPMFLGERTRPSSAYAANSNGSVIVGTVRLSPGADSTAFVWDTTHGMRAVSSLLEEAGIDLEGWNLSDARDVSADGRTLVGNGEPARGWIAHLP